MLEPLLSGDNVPTIGKIPLSELALLQFPGSQLPHKIEAHVPPVSRHGTFNEMIKIKGCVSLFPFVTTRMP